MQGSDMLDDNFVTALKKLYAIITGLFVLLIIAVFPLVYHNFYFDILPTKYKFYYCSALAMLGSMLVIGIVFLIFDGSKYKGAHIKAYLKVFNLKKIKAYEWAVILFLISATISTILSDYKFEAFWGNEGRFNGLFLLTLYSLTFLAISKFFVLKQYYFDIFLCSSLIVCILGILDYFKIDLLGFKQHMLDSQINQFASTLGNINTYTAYVALVLGMSAALFGIEKHWCRSIFYLISMGIGFFAIITGQSDNAYLALGILFALLPLTLFANKRGMKRYFVILTIFVTELQLVDYISSRFADKVIELNSLFNALAKLGKLEYVVIAMWVLCSVIYIGDYFLYKNRDMNISKAVRWGWSGILVVGFSAVCYILYDVNVNGNIEPYKMFEKYLVINDDWGTLRWYIWRIGMEMYQKFPLIQKIFGYGPETFGILTTNNYYSEMTSRYGVIFDSAHNEYIQYLITIGLAGLMSYVAMLASSVAFILKGSNIRKWIVSVVFATMCYGAQAFVNINLPIATPVMWVLLALGLAGARGLENT